MTCYEISDELSVESPKIIWQQGELVQYSNTSHSLLNRVIYIDDHLFESFRIEDRDYAKREFEAYLGFSLNAFQSLHRGREVLDTNTQATDCSVYDGWWD